MCEVIKTQCEGNVKMQQVTERVKRPSGRSPSPIFHSATRRAQANNSFIIFLASFAKSSRSSAIHIFARNQPILEPVS